MLQSAIGGVPDEPLVDFSCLPWYMRWRWVFVLLFLTPAALALAALEWVAARLRPVAPHLHDQRVARAQDVVRAARAAGQRVCTDRAGWQVRAIGLLRGSRKAPLPPPHPPHLSIEPSGRLLCIERM